VAILARPVNQSATTDLRATKMLIDMLKKVEHQAGSARAVLRRRERTWRR
jgi:Flp pilus assembly CpaE family ATPase